MSDHTDPSPLDVLLGRHPLGGTPEQETDWCRFCLMLGMLLGFMLGVVL